MGTINGKSRPIIKSIGYMWHRKYVNWQSGRKLIGTPEAGKGDRVDFANQAGIYVLYDKNMQPIYVGQAGKGETKGLYDRLKDHTEDELFCAWERFTWFGFYSKEAINAKCDDEFEICTDVNELMNIVESIIVRVWKPSFNKSSGCLHSDNSEEIIEWYYQEAEWEEQQEDFNRLKKICKSLGNHETHG